jgi:hypothetical protein
LITGNGSLLPSCFLFIRSLNPSLTVQWNLDLRKPDLRKNLDLRKIAGTTDFLVHKLFDRDFLAILEQFLGFYQFFFQHLA